MITQKEIAKLKVLLLTAALPLKYNNDRLITVPAVLAALDLITKSDSIPVTKTNLRLDINNMPIIDDQLLKTQLRDII